MVLTNSIQRSWDRQLDADLDAYYRDEDGEPQTACDMACTFTFQGVVYGLVKANYGGPDDDLGESVLTCMTPAGLQVLDWELDLYQSDAFLTVAFESAEEAWRDAGCMTAAEIKHAEWVALDEGLDL